MWKCQRKSFREIWANSEVFKNLRNTDGYQGKCGRCEFRKVCGVVGHGPMKSPGSTWRRSPIVSMSRFKSFFRFRISLTFKFISAMFFLVLMSAVAFGYFFGQERGIFFEPIWKSKGNPLSTRSAVFSSMGSCIQTNFFYSGLRRKSSKTKMSSSAPS